MTEEELKNLRCPYCPARFTSYEVCDGSGDRKEGVFVVCSRCNRMSVFKADLRLGRLTPKDATRFNTMEPLEFSVDLEGRLWRREAAQHLM